MQTFFFVIKVSGKFIAAWCDFSSPDEERGKSSRRTKRDLDLDRRDHSEVDQTLNGHREEISLIGGFWDV